MSKMHKVRAMPTAHPNNTYLGTNWKLVFKETGQYPTFIHKMIYGSDSCLEIQEHFTRKGQVMNLTNEKAIFKWSLLAFVQFCQQLRIYSFEAPCSSLCYILKCKIQGIFLPVLCPMYRHLNFYAGDIISQYPFNLISTAA